MARTNSPDLFFAAADAMSRYGTWVRRTSRVEDNVPTHTRTGTVGYYHDRDGIVRNSDADLPRVEWLDLDADGTNEVPCLIVEDAATNICLESADLSTTWTNTRTTDSTDATAGPDGNTVADELIEDATASSTHYISQAFTKAASALDYSFSVYLKKNTREDVQLWIWGTSDANRVEAEFDLDGGTVATDATAQGSGWTAYTAEIEPLASDWYRCTVRAQSNTDTDLNVGIFLCDAPGGDTYSGDGSSSAYVWGASLVQQTGAPVTSYVPTTTGSATRNADTFYADWLVPPQAMTVYVKMREHGTAFADQSVLHIGGATASSDPRFVITTDGSDNYRVTHDNATTAVSSTLGAAPAMYDTVELRAVLNADGSVLIGQSLNAGTESVASTSAAAALGSAWADQRIYLGSAGSSDQGYNPLVAVKIHRGVQTLAFMRALG